MSDVIKKNTKTLSLKNPSSTSLTKIIKDNLDIDIDNLKGSDIPKIFKKGLKFKGAIGKKIIDGVANYFKKNPNTIKRYEKSLPDTLKKKIDKLPVTTTPKKIRKIDIANIMKNPRTGRGQKLPVRTTNKNKNTGTNITKRVIEGEVLQGVKPPKGGGVRTTRTIEGQFKNISSKPKRIGNVNKKIGQDKLNIQGLKRKQFLGMDKDFPKMPPQQAPAKEEKKKVKPPKDFSPKIKKTPTPEVKKKELPKIKTPTKTQKKSRSNIVNSSSYDAQFTYDELKKRGLKPKGFMSPENYKKVKKYSSGTKDKTVGLKDLPPKSISPGIHKLPPKAKINMGFKPMFGGGFISSLYDKPEKAKKYKGNTSAGRQVKGYGKARKRP